jgi:hypothetical protein
MGVRDITQIKFYKFMAKIHYTNLLGAGLARAQQVGQQVGSMEFISQQIVQQVGVW